MPLRPLRLAIAFGCAAMLLSAAAAGRPPPQVLPDRPGDRVQAWLERARLLARPFPGQGDGGAPEPVALTGAAYDFDDVAAELDWDPATGAVDATVTLTVRAQQAADPAFYLIVDEGLSFTGATAAGYQVTAADSVYSPYNYGSVSISPPPTVGEQLVVEITYSGTLICGAYGARGHQGCGDDGELYYVMDGAALPLISDGALPYGFDTFPRSLTLRTPSGWEVLASADRQSSDDDGTTLTTAWSAADFSTSIYFVVLASDFGFVDTAGLAPPVRVAHSASSPEWSTEMASWMESIVPFLDRQAGASFPFAGIDVVKLPQLAGFPGTASHSMVYLSEVYGSRSAEEFEETLAHETSHEWWGVLVAPYDPTLWLVEGMAMLSQYDYTAERHYGAVDRHHYLGSRYHWNALLLRYLTDPAALPPLVLGPDDEYPTSLNESVTWAYYKSSATLDHLRLVVGEADFAEALAHFRAECVMEPCTTAHFRDALESVTGRDLRFFFDQWVYDTAYPQVTVAHEQRSNDSTGGVIATVRLEQDAPITLPLLLRARLVDGSVVEQSVELVGESGTFELELPARARSLGPSPRHDAIVWSESARPGDVDFSMQVDGRDLIRCARSLGTRAVNGTPPAAGIYDVDVDFVPRCDFDDDADVDETDLDLVLDRFGAGVGGSP